MSRRAVAALIAVGAALLADLYVYMTHGDLRAIFARNHWILYEYVGAEAAVIAGGLTLLIGGAWRAIRRAGDPQSDQE